MAICVLLWSEGLRPDWNDGMVEQWNNGLQNDLCWVDGKICVDDSIKIDIYFSKTNIPVFHHSIIPSSEAENRPQKTPHIFPPSAAYS
jgi:hypothetical protein